jgi:hypothetical protein
MVYNAPQRNRPAPGCPRSERVLLLGELVELGSQRVRPWRPFLIPRPGGGLLQAVADVSCPRAVRGNTLSIRSRLSSVSRGMAGRWHTCQRRRRSTTMCIHIRCRVRVVGARLPNPQGSPPMRPHCPGMGLERPVLDVQGVVGSGHSCRHLPAWGQYVPEFYEEFACNGNGATC